MTGGGLDPYNHYNTCFVCNVLPAHVTLFERLESGSNLKILLTNIQKIIKTTFNNKLQGADPGGPWGPGPPDHQK